MNALRRENLPQSAGTNEFAALGITGPPLDADRPRATRRSWCPGTKRSATIRICPWSRGTRTLARRRRADVRSGPAPPQDRRRAPRLPLRRLQPPVRARAGDVPAARSPGSPFARSAARASRRCRCSAPTTIARRCAPGRSNGFVQDDWRLTPRLTVNAGVRYEFNAPPYDADDRMRIFDLTTLQLQQVGANGVSRSGLQSGLQQRRAARRRELGRDRQRHAARARRLRHLLRHRHADRELGAVLQSAVLRRCSCSSRARSRSRWLEPVPGRARLLAARRRSTRSIPTSGPATRSRAASGVERIVRRARPRPSATSRRTANDLVRKRNINQAVPGPGPDRFAPSDCRVRRHPAGRVRRASSTLSRAGAERACGGRGAASRSAPPTRSAKSMDDTSAFLATDGDDNTPQDSRNLAAEWGPSDFDVRQRLVADRAAGPDRATRALAHRAQLAGQRRVHRAVGPSVHAARQLRQQQHRQRRRRHVRLRSPERRHRHRPPAGANVVSYGGQLFVIAPQYTFGNAGRNSLVGPGLRDAGRDGEPERAVGDRARAHAAARGLQRC